MPVTPSHPDTGTFLQGRLFAFAQDIKLQRSLSTMSKKTSSYSEIENIKDDLESLKTNVIELTRHLQDEGADKTEELAKKAKKRFSELQNRSKRELQKVERRVKSNPMQSMAIAFASGVALSILLGRR
jgi:ElaB/YqjD/DUF883 family membrane-anchored ribosome-binding protein